MDINLEGGREGIEVARWLRKVCEAPIVFIPGYTGRGTVERIHEQVGERRSWRRLEVKNLGYGAGERRNLGHEPTLEALQNPPRFAW